MDLVNPLDSKSNYSATSNNTKSIHWPLMVGLSHLVQWGGACTWHHGRWQMTVWHAWHSNNYWFLVIITVEIFRRFHIFSSSYFFFSVHHVCLMLSQELVLDFATAS